MPRSSASIFGKRDDITWGDHTAADHWVVWLGQGTVPVQIMGLHVIWNILVDIPLDILLDMLWNILLDMLWNILLDILIIDAIKVLNVHPMCG